MAPDECNYDYVELWKSLGNRAPAKPMAGLIAWGWFYKHVLKDGEIRERFKKEGLQPFLVFLTIFILAADSVLAMGGKKFQKLAKIFL